MATCHVYALLVLLGWFSLPTTLPIRTKFSDTTYFNLTTISVDQSCPFKQRHVIEDLLYNSQSDCGRRHFYVDFANNPVRKRYLRRKFISRKTLYYSNAVATHNILLLRGGDVATNLNVRRVKELSPWTTVHRGVLLATEIIILNAEVFPSVNAEICSVQLVYQSHGCAIAAA